MKAVSVSSRYLGVLLLTFFISVGCSKVQFEPTDLTKLSGQPLDINEPQVAPPLPSPPQDTVSEKFNFDNNASERKVDVLFIVDNSSSMYEEQQKLGDRLANFIGNLSKVNWQIAITTTDASDGPHGVKGSLLQLDGVNSKIITDKTPNYNQVFRNSVVRNETLTCQSGGACPSGKEQPLLVSMLAMNKRDTDNKDFFRSGADLALVILSDEDELSTGPPEATSPQAVLDHFNQIWGASKTLSVFGIMIQPDDIPCFDSQKQNGGNYAYYATELAAATGGVTGSICDSDYSTALERIGETLNLQVNSITLTQDPKTVVDVVITPHDPNLKWTVKGKKITFNKVPAEGSVVEVIYEKK